MKNYQRIFSVLLMFAFVFGSVAPALASESLAADPVNVVIQNKTGAETRLTLTGPATVYLSLATGKNKVELVPGTYKFSYEACGETVTGNFKVKGAGSTLTLPKCKTGDGGGGTKTIEFTINNTTDATIYFVFSGPQTYYLTAPVGKTKLTVEAGTYQWTASSRACGGYWEDNGNLKLKSDFKWTWYCL